MSETMGNRRTGGREGRRAVRLSHQVERLPFLTRTLAPFEVLGDEGLSIIEHNADTILEEVGIEFRGDEDALRLLRDAGADVDGERVRFPRGMCRQIVQATRTAPVHPVRPQRGEQRRDRRDAHGLRPELRLAVRARPGPWPALRHDRGLPQLREARLHEPAPAPQRRDGLRAGRRASQQAPPRHGLFAHPLQRQAVHGIGDRAGARARHGRDGAADVRRGLPRGPLRDPLA